MTAPSPLTGRRVVDLSQFIAGSVCGQLLADFGADVAKVEPVDGDPARVFADSRFGSTYYRSYNTGKSALALDLRNPADRRQLDELLAEADALVMNFALRSRERLALDEASLRRSHPHLVVTVVSAYGADDPRTCFDSIAQAVSGYALLNCGEDGRPRISAGYPTDVFSGLYAAMATAMVLLDPDRNDGVHVDVPMNEVAMTALGGPAFLGVAEGVTFKKGHGNRDAATAPSNIYRCIDGFCYVYAGLDKHWARLRPLVGGNDGSAAERMADAEAYDLVVEAWTSRHTVAQVCARMDELLIPAGPVRDPVQALADASGKRPGSVVRILSSGEAVPHYPALFSGERLQRTPAPTRPTHPTSKYPTSKQETAEALP